MLEYISHPNPPVIAGKTYDKLKVSLILSTEAPDGANMFLRTVITLTPYFTEQHPDGSSEIVLLNEDEHVFVFSDSIQQSRQMSPLATFLDKVASAGQAFIDEVLK